jgi:L-ascorbate metabolism protein UlaG (beta-lactamase superfamily)
MTPLHNSTGLRITYIGGPTALLEFGGLRLLTDPTFDPPAGEYRTVPVTPSEDRGVQRSLPNRPL